MALQLQGLRDRKTDIVVAYQYLEGSGASDLEVMLLIQEPLVVVLPKNHPLTSKSKISFSDLANEDFVLPIHQTVSQLSDQIYQLCSQVGFVPNIDTYIFL